MSGEPAVIVLADLQTRYVIVALSDIGYFGASCFRTGTHAICVVTMAVNGKADDSSGTYLGPCFHTACVIYF